MKRLKLWLSFMLIFSKVGKNYGYSSGAISSACNNMKPGHSPAPQTSAIPFQLSPEGQIVEAGEIINLKLKPTGSDSFKGFMVLAFDTNTNEKLGSFVIDSST